MDGGLLCFPNLQSGLHLHLHLLLLLLLLLHLLLLLLPVILCNFWRLLQGLLPLAPQQQVQPTYHQH